MSLDLESLRNYQLFSKFEVIPDQVNLGGFFVESLKNRGILSDSGEPLSPIMLRFFGLNRLNYLLGSGTDSAGITTWAWPYLKPHVMCDHVVSSDFMPNAQRGVGGGFVFYNQQRWTMIDPNGLWRFNGEGTIADSVIAVFGLNRQYIPDFTRKKG